MKHPSATTLSAIICATLLTTGAMAQSLGIESDGADRIRLAGQIPTLTQQVAAASCALTSDVNVEEARGVLEHATTDFDRYIIALRDGDEDLHILHPEEDRRTLAEIEHILGEWRAIHGAIEAILADGNDVESAHLIQDHNLALLDLTSAFATNISGQYSHPFEISASDVFLIELAGRQRMLTQKMAKDACEIWTGYNAQEATEDLRGTMGNFEALLNALLNGAPSMGVNPAPNDAIRADLEDLLGRWAVVKPNLQTLVDGGELDDAQKSDVFQGLEEKLSVLDHVLAGYKDYAERAH